MTTALDGRTILFVHPSDELYGADRCLLALVRGLPLCARAIVALPKDLEYAGALSRELRAAGAEVRQIDFAVLRRAGLRPRNWPMLALRLVVGSWRLARLARESEAAIVHTNTLAAVSGPVAAMLARRRHVWHVHEVVSDEHWAVRLVYRLLALLPGRLIANSNATARALAGPIRPARRKTSVVYPGLIEKREHASRAAGSGVLRVAFVGRLAPRKGVAELLEAIALLRARGVKLELTIFGGVPPNQEWRADEYRRRTVALGLKDVVRFEGFVADVPRRLEEFDVLVVPSQRPEPFGLVVLEGMAAGCSVIACRNGGGSDEILEHGRTGLYCGQTPSSIAAAIERIADEPRLRERLNSNASVVVGERYGLEHYLNGVLRVYQELLGEPPVGPPERIAISTEDSLRR